MVLGCKTGIIDSQEKEAPIEPTYYWKASDLNLTDNSTVSNWSSKNDSSKGMLVMTAVGAYESGGNLPLYKTIETYPFVRFNNARKNRMEIPLTDYDYVNNGFTILTASRFINNISYQRNWEMYFYLPSKSIFGEYYMSQTGTYTTQFLALIQGDQITHNNGSGSAWKAHWYITCLSVQTPKTGIYYKHQTNTWGTMSVANNIVNYPIQINMSDTYPCDLDIREFRIYKRGLSQSEAQIEVDKVLALYP